MAQAEGKGVDLVTLRALVEEASQSGATRALGALGLDDPRARRDMDELRELLSAWRDAKKSARHAVVTWFVGVCLALLLIGLTNKGLVDEATKQLHDWTDPSVGGLILAGLIGIVLFLVGLTLMLGVDRILGLFMAAEDKK